MDILNIKAGGGMSFQLAVDLQARAIDRSPAEQTLDGVPSCLYPVLWLLWLLWLLLLVIGSGASEGLSDGSSNQIKGSGFYLGQEWLMSPSHVSAISLLVCVFEAAHAVSAGVLHGCRVGYTRIPK